MRKYKREGAKEKAIELFLEMISMGAIVNYMVVYACLKQKGYTCNSKYIATIIAEVCADRPEVKRVAAGTYVKKDSDIAFLLSKNAA